MNRIISENTDFQYRIKELKEKALKLSLNKKNMAQSLNAYIADLEKERNEAVLEKNIKVEEFINIQRQLH